MRPSRLCFIEPELLPIEILHCGIRDFLPFPGYGDLDLDLMTFTYELDPYSLYTGCANMNFLRQAFRKLSSDWQTDRQTDRHDRNYNASPVVKKFAAPYKLRPYAAA